MKIAIASDHAGFIAKKLLKEYLESKGHTVVDCGSFSEERSDYPDYGAEAARLVSSGKVKRAFLVCGSGLGMCMVANRFKGVRAAVIRDENDAKLSRGHNDANVACFGARITGAALLKKLADLFLDTEFEGGRHKVRVEKIDSKGGLNEK
jgi:ribose 5-phosphate isomerase B